MDDIPEGKGAVIENGLPFQKALLQLNPPHPPNPPPPPPPPSLATRAALAPAPKSTKKASLVRVQKSKEEMEMADCDNQKPCFMYKCTEKKRKLNFGTKVEPRPVSCKHVQVGGEGCEKCCRLIYLGNYVISLHCAWHHCLRECHNCKKKIDDKPATFNGSSFCFKCYQRVSGNHASELKTVHYATSD